ncbi:MAG TPA: lysophospholipid acyltransferase family protein [Acidimicrobiales bacterium]
MSRNERVDRAVEAVRDGSHRVRSVVANRGFPYRSPTVPRGVAVPPKKKHTGADFDTDWARTPVARATRTMLVNGPLRGLVKAVADPEVVGLDRLADLRASIEEDEPAPPVVFAANHASHVDAPLLLTSVPAPWRSRLVVGAAADYFFATRVTGALSALALGAIPIDRSRVNRRSADLASSLIDEGWSLLIFPEGGRSPDGWGQPFRGGAAFLSIRSGVPVVPVHLDGTGAILGRGMKRPKPGRTKVTFGAPLMPREGEDARRFGERIEAAVAVLGDEAITDWWSARRRAAAGETPALTGPAYTGWRRAWALSEHRARGKAGQRRRQRRSWPSFD